MNLFKKISHTYRAFIKRIDEKQAAAASTGACVDINHFLKETARKWPLFQGTAKTGARSLCCRAHIAELMDQIRSIDPHKQWWEDQPVLRPCLSVRKTLVRRPANTLPVYSRVRHPGGHLPPGRNPA
ncbi:MAG: hypothetical protein R2861_07070 [Desulfobacterales bacterium]